MRIGEPPHIKPPRHQEADRAQEFVTASRGSESLAKGAGCDARVARETIPGISRAKKGEKRGALVFRV